MATDVMNVFRRALLRIALGYAAIGWGICVAGIFVSAPAAFDLLAYVGGVDPTALKSDPMYDYWLRMASSTFAFIGLGYLILAIWPRKFASVLPFAGSFMVIEGIILWIRGVQLGLDPFPFWGDASFCLIGGVGILLCMGSVRGDKQRSERSTM